MTVKLSSCRVDAKREREGDWVESVVLPSVSFKVRSTTYPAYTVARDMLQQKLRRKAGSKPIPETDWIPAHGRLYHEHLLLDWKGFDEEYSPENAERVMTDFEFRLVISAVEMAAASLAQADIDFVEEQSKNSETSSASS